tara:strand:- start:105 stop:554 length:450 start_codon:yes stop_codon:yes gene_type:complete
MRKINKKIFCRTCGKPGWKTKGVSIKLSSGVMNTQKWKKTCSYCKSFPINDDDWQKLVDNNLIKDEKITKKGLKYLQVQSIELKKKNNQESKINNKNQSNILLKGINLIPDSIFGIVAYVLLILFCIWFLGDYGAECGVDYAPRFFGEC